jgi:hypothetical protein
VFALQKFDVHVHVDVAKALNRFAAALKADGGDAVRQDAACDKLLAFAEKVLGGAVEY